jgi:hypothetical protein
MQLLKRSEIIKSLIHYSTDIPNLGLEIERKYNLAEDDARLSFFGKVESLFYSMTFMSILIDKYLVKGITSGWWEKIPNQYGFEIAPVDGSFEDSIGRTIDRVDMTMILTYIQFLFSSLESTIRLLVRNINPIKYEQGRNSFKTLISWLLEESRVTETHSDFIEIISILRNSVHNNGVYSPTSSKATDKKIVYNGIICDFKINHKINVGVNIWQLLFHLTDECLSIVKGIITSPEIIQKSYIKDPSYIR